MNAESLLGTVLGRCTLQKLVGQGGMGAVYLAQQSRPRRLVAVKVLLPMVPLSPHQLAAFLERFRRETDAAAALEHPHIMPVYEYGENGGTAYLVMPYISGGTLRDELEREGPFSMPKVVNYLEQIASALDFAHEHGVIHRDIKPANIMVTQDERLLLTDFGLVKIMDDSRIPQSPMRLTGAGAPVGTPDYMAPEQVIGDVVDTRADLYSLGIILYQMVTGTTPFHGETPMQIAAQHLQIPPPSPQMLRPDLPISAEQVILRALAKRPADRYMRADSMASDFRQAIIRTGISLEENYARSGMLLTASRLPVPESLRRNTARGQAPAERQNASFPTMDQRGSSGLFRQTGAMPSAAQQEPITQTNAGLPTPGGGGLLSRTGKFPMVGSGTGMLPANSAIGNSGSGGGLLSRTGKFPMVGEGFGVPTMTANVPTATTNAFEESYFSPSTGTLPVSEASRAKETVKLSGAMKVVKVPVAGHPGHFVTGLLPFAPVTPEQVTTGKKNGLGKTAVLIIAVVLVVLGSLSAFWFVHTHGSTTGATQTPLKPLTAAQVKATSIVHSTATAVAYNTILTDALDRNIHGWQTDPASAFAFKNGAYYVTDDQKDGRAVILPVNALPNKLVYTLTMQEIKGDDNSTVNSFGMIFRLTQSPRAGSDKPISKFYSFEVVNKKGGDYQFWKYDDTNTNAVPWSMIADGKLPVGNEFHQGQGTQAVNTFSIAMDGSNFSVTVNSMKLPKTFQDNSYTNGSVGMIVNQQGTQIAFKNLFLTRQ